MSEETWAHLYLLVRSASLLRSTSLDTDSSAKSTCNICLQSSQLPVRMESRKHTLAGKFAIREASPGWNGFQLKAASLTVGLPAGLRTLRWIISTSSLTSDPQLDPKLPSDSQRQAPSGECLRILYRIPSLRRYEMRCNQLLAWSIAIMDCLTC